MNVARTYTIQEGKKAIDRCVGLTLIFYNKKTAMPDDTPFGGRRRNLLNSVLDLSLTHTHSHSHSGISIARYVHASARFTKGGRVNACCEVLFFFENLVVF